MRSCKGSTQSMTVFVVSVITLLCLAAAIIFFVTKELRVRDLNKKKAQEVAEYGIQMALDKIQENPTWCDGFSSVNYHDGHYTVVIDKIGDSTYRATSSGYVKNITNDCMHLSPCAR